MEPPALPTTNASSKELMQQCEHVLQLTLALEPNLREISEQTQQIEPLSSAVLDRINSAAWGLQHTIESVDQAVALLGARRLSYLVRTFLNTDGGRLEPQPDEAPDPNEKNAA